VITVVVNPAAGSAGEGADAELVEHFRKARLPIHLVTCLSGADAAAAAKAALKDRAEVVVAAGGDGTVSAVASALIGTDTPLGVLPRGTLNHFAKDAGIPLDLGRAVKNIAEGRSKAIDVGDVNGRHFLNNVSLGIYPDIVVERESLRQQGYRKWSAFGVATARIIRNYRGLMLTITTQGTTRTTRTPFLLVGNNEYRQEGIHLGERKALDGGQLFAYFAPRMRARELPKLFADAVLDRAAEGRSLDSLAACELRAESHEGHRFRVAVDGEVLSMTAPLLFRTHPGALHVIVPQA
jgi:diacylglycerol kinase family enzyme